MPASQSGADGQESTVTNLRVQTADIARIWPVKPWDWKITPSGVGKEAWKNSHHTSALGHSKTLRWGDRAEEEVARLDFYTPCKAGFHTKTAPSTVQAEGFASAHQPQPLCGILCLVDFRHFMGFQKLCHPRGQMFQPLHKLGKAFWVCACILWQQRVPGITSVWKGTRAGRTWEGVLTPAHGVGK